MKKIAIVLFIMPCLFSARLVFAQNNRLASLSKQKKAFVGELHELSEKMNDRILVTRKKIKSLYAKPAAKLSKADKAWLQQVAKKYRIDNFDANKPADWQQLLSRVDIVPPSLLVAQAAIESAWGTSRFATAGNNFFGQWCYQKGCGIVPRRRPAGRHYEVQKFATPADAVSAYVYNLNTNRTYKLLRQKRLVLREEKKPITGYALAEGLKNYSQLGEKYIGIVRGVIKHYQLSHLNRQTNAPKQA